MTTRYIMIMEIKLEYMNVVFCQMLYCIKYIFFLVIFFLILAEILSDQNVLLYVRF